MLRKASTLMEGQNASLEVFYSEDFLLQTLVEKEFGMKKATGL